jgi:hypothetical protein
MTPTFTFRLPENETLLERSGVNWAKSVDTTLEMWASGVDFGWNLASARRMNGK